MVATTDRVTSHRVNREFTPPESPDLSTFTLKFLGFTRCGKYPGFQGKGMRDRCQVASKIHAPDASDENHDWHDLNVSRWMSPCLHDERADLYKLRKAIDPTFEFDRDAHMYEEEDEDGKIHIGFDYDAIELMAEVEDGLYVSLVGPNKNGYPEVQGDPAPFIAPENRRRRQRPSVVATVVEPEPPVEEEGEDDFDDV